MLPINDPPRLPGQRSPEQPRLLQVDGLRGLAALSVVMFHYTTRYDQVFAHAQPLPFSFPSGHLGVQLFFVISGFVIFMTLERVKAPLDFVVSRFSRLFPTYWTAVVVTAVLLTLSGLPGYRPPLSLIVANLSMVQELFGLASIDGAYWSLEIELIFYIWMLALWAMGLLKVPVLIFGAWIAAVTVTQWLGVGAGLFPVPHGISHVLLFRWIPWFSLGIAAYLWYREGRLSMSTLTLVCLATAAIWIRSEAALASLGVLFFALVVLASQGRAMLLNWKPLVALGAVSYPLYLLHEKIGLIAIMRFESWGASPAIAILAALAASIAAAAAAHSLVETRATRAIRNWYSRRKQKTGVVAIQGRIGLRRERPLGWIVACGLVLCVAMGGGRISHFLKGEAHAAASSRLVGINQWSPEDAASREACAQLSAQGAPLVLVLGQSNAASHGEPGATPLPAWVFHAGLCGRTSDPLPGTTGGGASIWPLLARQLRAEGTGTAGDASTTGEAGNAEVVFAPVAIGATRIAEWTSAGPVNGAFRTQLEHVAASGFTVTAVVWQQGEADMLSGTDSVKYQASLDALGAVLEQYGIGAPLFLARSTYCRQYGSGAIRRAVDRYLAAASSGTHVRAGADTDQLVGEYRYDGCHFSQAGLKQAAILWAEILKPELEVRD